MASVSSSNQVNQENLLSHLARVTSQVPDAKAATLAQADEIKGIFPSFDYFSTHFTNSDGRANLMTVTSSFQSTVHHLSDIDKPFFTDESALRCALLRFYDRGSHDASLNDFRPRGSPTIATIDHFTAACSYLVKIFPAFFGNHMIAPLENLMCPTANTVLATPASYPSSTANSAPPLLLPPGWRRPRRPRDLHPCPRRG